jgi:hypothetical protein
MAEFRCKNGDADRTGNEQLKSKTPAIPIVMPNLSCCRVTMLEI